MAVAYGEKGARDVPQEVPAISNLNGGGSALANAVRISAGAIAGDDRNAWVPVQPFSEGAGIAIRHEIDDASTLEIAQDRPNPLAPAPRPIVDPEHPRVRGGGRWLAPDEAKDAVGAQGRAQPRPQSQTALATHGHPEVTLPLRQPLDPPSMRSSNAGKALGKDGAAA